MISQSMFFIIIMSGYMLWEENFVVAYKNDQKNNKFKPKWFSHILFLVFSYGCFCEFFRDLCPIAGTPPPLPQISPDITPDEGDLITHVSWYHY